MLCSLILRELDFSLTVINNLFLSVSEDKSCSKMEIGEREQTVFKYEDIQLLVIGYCNNEASQFIPNVIIDIFVMYLNSVVYCYLSNEQMIKDFISTKCGFNYFAKSVNIEGVEFEYKIFPNGHKISDGGNITFYINIPLFPAHILGITLYFEFFCNELNYKIKKLVTFSTNKKRWYPFKFPMNEITDNLQKLSSIKLNCFMDILRIKYKNKDNPSFDSQKGMKMSKQSQYKWKIDDNFRAKRKYKKIFYSKTIDHCWCLYWKLGSSLNTDSFYLQLLKLPNGISSVIVNFECTGREKKYNQEFSYYTKDKQIYEKHETITMKMDQLSVDIKIVRLYDMNDQLIDKAKWNLYLDAV